MNLNIPPNQYGQIDERDVKRLREFGDLLKKEFAQELICDIRQEDGALTQPVYTITLEHPADEIRYVVLLEDISRGQRVETFRIMAESSGGDQYPLYQGTCIGHKRICQLQDPFADQNPLINNSGKVITKLKVQITAARDQVIMRDIKVYG